MLDEGRILEILENNILPVLKDRNKVTNRFVKSEEKEYYEGYNLFNSWRNGIRVHAETGVFPQELLASRSPNATPKVWDYIKRNYKQVTMPLAVDYLSTIGRAWSDDNWSIDYKGDEDFQEYVEKRTEDTPLRMGVESYFRHVFPYVKMIDSMGCIAIKPHKVPTVENEQGERVISGTELVEPIPVYYSTAQLVAYDEEQFYMFETKEKSLVEYGGKTVREGMVYEVYDDMNIWKVVQVGKKIDYEFEIFVYYPHEGNAIPVSRCKGVPVVHGDDIVWQSRFLAVKDLLDEVILDSVYLRAVKNISAFPYRVMVGNVCNHKLEINGEIQTCDDGYFHDYNSNKEIMCDRCNGTGSVDRVSPYGEMLLKPQTRESEGEANNTQPAMYYVSPPIDTPEFLRKEIEHTFARARSILHLHTSNTEVKGSEDMTATGMALDMKALYAFVKGDSDQTFSSYEWALNWIGFMRTGQDPEFALTYPQSFDFYTDMDYLYQVSEAIRNGLPPFLVHATVLKYMKSLFSSDTEATKAYDLIISADRLITMTEDEVALGKAQGVIAPYEIVLHDSGMTFINELIEENPGFFDQDISLQKEQLIQKAKDTSGGR